MKIAVTKIIVKAAAVIHRGCFVAGGGAFV